MYILINITEKDIVERKVYQKISGRTISTLANAWNEDPCELARLLNLPYEKDLIALVKTDEEMCNDLISSWIQSHQDRDQKKELKSILKSNGRNDLALLIN